MNRDDSFKPEDWPRVTPRIVMRDAGPLVEFIKHVFGATGNYQTDQPTILTIGDSKIMISEADIRQVSSAFLYVYVENADVTYDRATEMGAQTLEQPLDTPYGDRRAMIQDQWGNTWQIATYRRTD